MQFDLIVFIRQIQDLKENFLSKINNDSLVAIFNVEIEQLKSRIISRDRTITMLKDQITQLKHESKSDSRGQALQSEIEKLNLDVTRTQMLYDIRGKGLQQLHKQVYDTIVVANDVRCKMINKPTKIG